MHSSTTGSFPATTVLVNNSGDSELASRTVVAIISEGEPAHWNTETLQEISQDESSAKDEAEAAKASRQAKKAKRAERRVRAAQRALAQATAARDQGDQGSQSADNRQHCFYDNHCRNLMKDLDNVEQVYNNPIINITEGVKLLRQNQDLSPQLR